MSAKYPRSFHLPWSPGGTRDDKRLASIDALIAEPVVITEKLDGSNLALTRDAVYARSHSGPPSHPSFAWAKALHARVGAQIDAGLTLFGEYCYAVHSITYEALPDYFFLFGVREDDTGHWWSWEMVEAQAAMLGLVTVPVLLRGSFADLEKVTRAMAGEPSVYGGVREGVVVRVERGFANDEFDRVVGKYVRADHVTTSEHWMFQEIKPQVLR